jgi:hypothetical protein
MIIHTGQESLVAPQKYTLSAGVGKKRFAACKETNSSYVVTVYILDHGHIRNLQTHVWLSRDINIEMYYRVTISIHLVYLHPFYTYHCRYQVGRGREKLGLV